MYRLLLSNPAQKDLDRLRGKTWEHVRDRLLRLREDPRPRGYLKLKGDEGYRVRIGDHRAIYDIDDEAQTVTILRVKHRRDVCRDL